MVPPAGPMGMRMPGMMMGAPKSAESPDADAGPGYRAVAAAASLSVLYTTDAGALNAHAPAL
jgi:hypothetical protein